MFGAVLCAKGVSRKNIPHVHPFVLCCPVVVVCGRQRRGAPRRRLQWRCNLGSAAPSPGLYYQYVEAIVSDYERKYRARLGRLRCLAELQTTSAWLPGAPGCRYVLLPKPLGRWDVSATRQASLQPVEPGLIPLVFCRRAGAPAAAPPLAMSAQSCRERLVGSLLSACQGAVPDLLSRLACLLLRAADAR